jgi:hypothetical protein
LKKVFANLKQYPCQIQDSLLTGIGGRAIQIIEFQRPRPFKKMNPVRPPLAPEILLDAIADIQDPVKIAPVKIGNRLTRPARAPSKRNFSSYA